MAHPPTFYRNPDIVYRQIDGGGVLLNIKSGAYHEINSTAREIWEALETPSTESEVLERLVVRFGDVDDLGSDISEFIRRLEERDLIFSDTDSTDHL
ncbi:MAG: PqqD family protein [Actinomycetota bacterium]